MVIFTGAERTRGPPDRDQALKTIFAGLGALGPLDVMKRIAHVLSGAALVDDQLLDGYTPAPPRSAVHGRGDGA